MDLKGRLVRVTPEKIIEVSLAEDLKELISINNDVIFDDANLKNQILGFDDNVLIQSVQEIGSSIKILSVAKVDEDFIAKEFNW